MQANLKRAGPGGKKKKRDKKKRSASGAMPPPAPPSEKGEDLVFEDPFGDEMIDEAKEMEDIGADEQMGDAGGTGEAMADAGGEEGAARVWRPGTDKLEEGEYLDYDSRAYTAYHRMQTEWSCLSFDFVRDKLGDHRNRFPATAYMVAGTQAAQANQNQISVMKLFDLHKTHRDGVEDEDSGDDDMDDDDDLDDDASLDVRSIKHQGGVNRIRSMPQQSNIVATWADTGKVHMWDLQKQLAALDGPPPPGTSSTAPPIFTYEGHADEGFAMDWSAVAKGRFVSGDCSTGGNINLWQPRESDWAVDPVPFQGHTDSVEDLQWSPTEENVFISCSADKTVRVWDVRRKTQCMIDIVAHTTDVNVISWNTSVAYLLVSGSDDGSFKIWDLRNFKADKPVANFSWHKGPITSVEWHPQDESTLAVGGADNQITIWDLSLEEDDADGANAQAAKDAGIEDLPPQLVFVHQGQQDIKELHFHPQFKGLIGSTALDGFNVFKPSNIDNEAQPAEKAA
jgi:ribosome assembly protein RRB1